MKRRGKTSPVFNPAKPTNTCSMCFPQNCTDPHCFFCIMKEPDSSLRREGLSSCLKEMPLRDDEEHVLVLSGIWNIAMTHPDDPDLPYLGIFECMASLIYKGINDPEWLLRDQNVYIPYYAAHIIGSYTMNKVEFAEKAVTSGVIPPLMELLRGKMSWVEQRVAVRALGHLASYERTFEAVAAYQKEVVKLAMLLASSCLDVVYVNFVGIKEKSKRLKYHANLLTRGVGGIEMENRKAEEWASQLQCWSIYLLNCFACKKRSLNLICKQEFLKDLCRMWGGLVNHASAAGVGLIRILCHSQIGRESIVESSEVLESLCHLSRSSDDWQYMGIDCLLLLLKDVDTRYRVLQTAAFFLIDLVELKSLGNRSNLGESITKALLLDNNKPSSKLGLKNGKVQKALQEIWELKVEKRKKEKMLSEEKVEEKRVLVELIKQQAKHLVRLGDVETAIRSYTEALDVCPLKLRKERMVLYSSRAQCHLLLGDPDSTIRDTTRALCLSNPPNSHSKSLWRRSQAYDMKGLAKESVMDCIMFVNGYINSGSGVTNKKMKIPYLAVRLISKHMEETWLFSCAEKNYKISDYMSKVKDVDYEVENMNAAELKYNILMNMLMEKKSTASALFGLSTIVEEPFRNEGKRSEQKGRRRNRSTMAPTNDVKQFGSMISK